MEKLLSDINNYEKLKNSSAEFIKHHTLKKITTYKNMISSKLPINTIFGSTYLIKNNNIIHFYSFYDSDYSPHIEVNLRVKRWLCITDVINKENTEVLRPCPSDSLPPYEMPNIVGKILLNNVVAGECIKWEDLKSS